MPGHIDESARRSVKQLFRMGTSTMAIPNAILWLFCLQTSVLAVDKFILEPASTLTAIQTESIELTWILEMTVKANLNSLKVELKPTGASNAKADAFYKQSDKSVQYRKNWAGRSADFSLNVTVSGRNVTVHFIMKNLNKATDEGDFDVSSASSEDTRTSIRSALTINVPPVIISSHPYTIHTKEAHKVDLVCNSTGFPAPTVNWTRNGALIGTGNPYQVQVTPQDHNQCYTCVVFNGVYGAKTANVCLAVQFKPYGNHQITFDKPTVCQNNKVNVTCKSGPSNPPASNFIFYYSNQLVQNSSSHFYIGNAKNGIPGYNMFSCIPGNLLGDALNNVTGKVLAKVTPTVTSTTNNPVVSEGSNLALKCNVSGSPNLTVTWTRSGKPPRTGNEYTITNINRADDGPYHCTVDNGDECPTNAATINVDVNFKAEGTSMSSKRNNNTYLRGENVTLLCASLSKPQTCDVTFYNGSDVLVRFTNKTCNGTTVASHVISHVNRCGKMEFSCQAENVYGKSGFSNLSVVVNDPIKVNTVPSSNKIFLVEGSSLDLNCSATGCPEPNITWTKEGNQIPLGQQKGGLLMQRFSSLAKDDTGTYTCTIDNQVVGSPIARSYYVNVTYTPFNTTISSSLTKTCLNDSVTLSCTTKANPLIQEYRFYRNERLIHTSTSGIYTFAVDLPGNNVFTCEPKNQIGPGVNATISILTKDPPVISFSSPSKTFSENERVSLVCNVTGSEPLNVTWKRIGGVSYPEGSIKLFSSISRHDKAEYQCSAENGKECPAVMAKTTVDVIYKPENVSFSSNESSSVMLNSPMTLSCRAFARPNHCQVLFYQGYEVLANKSSSSCSASHIVHQIKGCNQESFRCLVINKAGADDSYLNVTVKVPAKIKLKPSSNVVMKKEGESMQFNCSTMGCPSPNITWEKEGRNISLGTTTGNYLLLDFKALTRSDTGYYICHVKSDVDGSDKYKRIYLNVTYSPRNTKISSSRNRTCLKDLLTLSCAAKANPPVLEYRFYLNGTMVHNTNTGLYTFNVSQSGHNLYTCEPMNQVGNGENATIFILTKEPPRIDFATSNSVVEEGGYFLLMCNVTASRPFSVTWKKHDGPSISLTFVKIFPKISRNDEALYECIANNGKECPIATTRSNITITYKPENTSLKTSTKVACRYDKMTLTCVSHAKPPVHNYKFYRNRLLIANSSNGLYTYNMTVNGSNVYTCTPENIVGSGQSTNVTVQVKVSPIIRSVTASQDVVEGSNFTLNCDVWDNSGSLDVSWHRVGGGKLSNTSSYTFENILRTQTGFYECHASNGNECDATSKKANIKVQYQPKITSSSSNSHTVDENDLLTLTCKVDGYPTPTITWKKEGASETLHQGDTFIFRATGSAKGKYSCSVSNGVGQTQSKSFDINVVGYCGQHQCRDGTVCVSQRKSYYCKCKPGLKGRFCEDKDSSQSKIELLLTFSKPTFTKELADKSSKEFKDTEKLICDMLRNKIFPNSVDDCSIIFFRSSSLESNVELRFTKPKLLGEIEESIKNATSDGTKLSDDLVLKGPYSFKASAFGTPCSKNPCQFDGVCKEEGDGFKCECQSFRHGTTCEKGIGVVPGAIIIAACLLLLIVIIFLCCLYFRRSNNSYEKEIASYGTKMDEMRYRSTKDHVASSENYSFEEEYLRQGRYRGTPLSKDNESDQEIEDKNKNLEFQTFNKNTEVRSIHAVSPDPTYTDIIAAMMNTPDEHQSNDTQNSTNESLDNVEVEGNSKASTLKLEKEKPNDQESSAHVDTKMTADYNGPLIGYTSNYDETSPNSTKECKQENPYIIDNSNFTMDPKESEGKLYPKLIQ